jgi:hypothetical protein
MSSNTSCSFAKPRLSAPSYPLTRLHLWFLSVRAKDLTEGDSHSFPPQGRVTRVVCPPFLVISLSAKTVAADLQTAEKDVNDDVGFQALVETPSN